MTNKQIIIDGLDVSGCVYFKMNNKMSMCRACNSGIGTPYCEYHKDCYYKQLKRKEQECEELKDEIKHYKQITQHHGNLSVKYTNKSARYKQALTKIKDIAEKYYRTLSAEKDCIKCNEFLEQILQKINECEV